MPPKKNKRKAKILQSETQKPVYLRDCKDVHINNSQYTIVQTEKSKPSIETTKKSNEGLAIVKTILTNRKNRASLDVLKDDIQDVLKKSDLHSFEQISGCPLDQFIRKHSDILSVESEGKTKYVRLLQQSDWQNDNSYAGAVKGACETLNDFSDTETVYHDAMDSLSEVGTSSTNEAIANDHGSECSAGEWLKVQKRGKGKRCIPEPLNEFYAREIVQNKDDETIASCRLKNFLATEEHSHLKFVRDPLVYEVNPLQCQLDIVSMWNTPQSLLSVIIIGPLKRNKEAKQMYDKVRLFSDDNFTSIPFYSYSTAQYDANTYGVINISSSWKQGGPSVVKKSVNSGNISLSEGEIWWRIGTENVVCPHIDIRIGLIYQWFLGTEEDCHKPIQPQITRVKPSAPDVEPITREKVGEPDEFETLCSKVDGFKKGHYILMSGDVSNKLPNLAHFALIPFLSVFDFDVFSCTNGLLNALQDSLEQLRQLQIATWKESPPCPSENSTYWCFLRGRLEISSSRTDSLDGTFENAISWFKTAKEGIVDNCTQVAAFADNYTVLRILILWPQSPNLIPMMRKFLERLVESLTHTPSIIICMHTDAKSPKERVQLKTVLDDFESCDISICRMDFSDLGLGISKKLGRKDTPVTKYKLPSSSAYLTGEVDMKDAMWLKEDLEVLYLSNPYPETTEDNLKSENLKFYKGGTLNWFAWYANGDDGVDIDRDVLKDLTAKVDKERDQYRSTIITLLHAPGSGGSTLAQRVLWNFHNKLPCVHAKAGTFLKSKDLPKKIDKLYETTQLSILIMVDGEDDAIVKNFCRSVKHSIILHVKRYPYNMESISHKKDVNKIYLKGTVSENEAGLLVAKFTDRCEDLRGGLNLKKMKDNIIKKKNVHNMYEFGMTVYQHEFRGTVSYVRGYLQLKPQGPLEHWQLCLGYLSLVYFYGQTSVPAQFFSRLYGKQSNYLMSLGDNDFGYPATEFIVYDTNDKRRETIRICHFEVAKEILEQILTRGVAQKNDHRTERLGDKACRSLATFVKEFIAYCAKKTPRNNLNLCQSVRYILTKTFIYRDEKDTGEREELGRKRPQLSQLLTDIPAGKNVFTDRLDVLDTLSTSFPTDPNFHAHVGRFYAFCGPEDEQKAEARFKKALELCDRDDESTKLTLSHVYHMYGILKQRRIKTLIEKSTPERQDTVNHPVFFEKLKGLVEKADEACGYFQKSRELTPDTVDIFAHAYISELNVRLHICDYVMRKFKSNADEDNAFTAFFESEADKDSKVFIEDSISKTEMLIMECNHDVALEPHEQRELRKLVKWFHGLFSKQNLPDIQQSSDDKVSKLRFKITHLKLNNHGYSGYSGDIDQVKDSGTVHHIVELYEEIFKEIERSGHGDKSDKKALDLDYREWIFAIRHDLFQKNYTLEDTLSHVQNWHRKVKSSMSTFYLFVIKSILGFGTDASSGNTEFLIDAAALRRDLTRKSNLVFRPKLPREWFGVGDGVRIMHSGCRRQDGKDHSKAPGTELTVCKGTILHPNTKPYIGHIEFDKTLGMEKIQIYFIPSKTSLEGVRYAGKRVEFKLAFTIEHGYEAFSVNLLKRHGCSKCSANVEFTSADSSLFCQNCQELIYKDELTEVRDPDPESHHSE